MLRLTWQVSRRNKVNIFGDNQYNCLCRGFAPSTAPEAWSSLRFRPQGLYQVSWSSPVTGRLLFEAAAAAVPSNWPNYRQPEVSPDDISFLETRTGLRYNSSASTSQAAQSGGYGANRDISRYTSRFSTSYITGSHAFKVGLQFDQANTAMSSRRSKARRR